MLGQDAKGFIFLLTFDLHICNYFLIIFCLDLTISRIKILRVLFNGTFSLLFNCYGNCCKDDMHYLSIAESHSPFAIRHSMISSHKQK